MTSRAPCKPRAPSRSLPFFSPHLHIPAFVPVLSLVVIIADPHAVIIASCPFSPAVWGTVPSLTWILTLALTEQGRRVGSSFAVGAGAAHGELRGRSRSGGVSGAQ